MSLNFNDDESSGSDPFSLITKMSRLKTSNEPWFADPLPYVSAKVGAIQVTNGTAYPIAARGCVKFEQQGDKIVVQYALRPTDEVQWTMIVDPYELYAQYLKPPKHPRVVALKPLSSIQIFAAKSHAEKLAKIRQDNHKAQIDGKRRDLLTTSAQTTTKIEGNNIPGSSSLHTPRLAASTSLTPSQSRHSSSHTPSTTTTTTTTTTDNNNNNTTHLTSLVPPPPPPHSTQQPIISGLFKLATNPNSNQHTNPSFRPPLPPLIMNVSNRILPIPKHFWFQEEDQSKDSDIVDSINRILRPGLDGEDPPSPSAFFQDGKNGRVQANSIVLPPSLKLNGKPGQNGDGDKAVLIGRVNPTHNTLLTENQRLDMDREVSLFEHSESGDKFEDKGDEHNGNLSEQKNTQNNQKTSAVKRRRDIDGDDVQLGRIVINKHNPSLDTNVFQSKLLKNKNTNTNDKNNQKINENYEDYENDDENDENTANSTTKTNNNDNELVSLFVSDPSLIKMQFEAEKSDKNEITKNNDAKNDDKKRLNQKRSEIDPNSNLKNPFASNGPKKRQWEGDE